MTTEITQQRNFFQLTVHKYQVVGTEHKQSSIYTCTDIYQHQSTDWGSSGTTCSMTLISSATTHVPIDFVRPEAAMHVYAQCPQNLCKHESYSHIDTSTNNPVALANVLSPPKEEAYPRTPFTCSQKHGRQQLHSLTLPVLPNTVHTHTHIRHLKCSAGSHGKWE